MSDRKISITITTWNRVQQTIDCFAQVLHDERVSEIVITDDASEDDSFEHLVHQFRNEPKVFLFQNRENLDCYRNKREAIENADSNWVCLWDSDNVFDERYLNALYTIPKWDSKTIYQPQFARPHFDFRKWAGLTINRENVAQYADTDLMTSLNAMNFFVDRHEFLRVWDGSVDPGSSDSIFFSYTWINAGNSIFITPGLEYKHFISNDNSGHYQQNSHKYVGFHRDLINKIKLLK